MSDNLTSPRHATEVALEALAAKFWRWRWETFLVCIGLFESRCASRATAIWKSTKPTRSSMETQAGAGLLHEGDHKRVAH